MTFARLNSLYKQKPVAVVLICIIILTPVVILGHAEIAYGTYDQTPSASIDVYTLSDVWYPRHGDWQPNPILVKGSINSYYNRPLLMCPNRVIVEVFVEDTTNSSSDLSFFELADYAFLQDTGYVNTTFTPMIDGNFGDAENYIANETEWTFWNTAGLPTVSSSLEQGINYRNMDYTKYQSGDRYSICTMEFGFGTDVSLRVYQWSLLLELALILEGAEQIAGHGLSFTIMTTISWIPVLVVGIPGGYSQTVNVTRGDGIADNGVSDYSLYMLEGDLDISYRIHDGTL
jgi:hypothetical protein